MQFTVKRTSADGLSTIRYSFVLYSSYDRINLRLVSVIEAKQESKRHKAKDRALYRSISTAPPKEEDRYTIPNDVREELSAQARTWLDNLLLTVV